MSTKCLICFWQWTQGCEGGESVQEMSDRADEAVTYVRKIHQDWLSEEGRSESDRGGDVVILTHGHFSRVFLARWLGLPLAQGQLFTVDVGGVSKKQLQVHPHNTDGIRAHFAAGIYRTVLSQTQQTMSWGPQRRCFLAASLRYVRSK